MKGKTNLTAHDVMRVLSGREAQTITPPTEADRAAADGPLILIVNVSPESFTVALGNLGTFVIPGCTERSPGILHINRIVFDTEIDIEKTVNVQDFPGGPWRMVPAFKHVPIDGMEVAREIVGTAKYKQKSEDLTRWGVFIAEGSPEPHKAEIGAEEIRVAREKLHQSYSSIVREMVSIITEEWAGSLLNISDKHMQALEYIRKTGRLSA